MNVFQTIVNYPFNVFLLYSYIKCVLENPHCNNLINNIQALYVELQKKDELSEITGKKKSKLKNWKKEDLVLIQNWRKEIMKVGKSTKKEELNFWGQNNFCWSWLEKKFWSRKEEKVWQVRKEWEKEKDRKDSFERSPKWDHHWLVP